MKKAQLSDMSVEQLVERFKSITLEQYDAMELQENSKYNRLIDPMLEVSSELGRRHGDRRDALLPLLKHFNPQVRFMAAVAVLKSAPAEARAAFQKLVDNKEYPQAADALGMLRSLDQGRHVPE